MESEHGGRWRTAFHDISRRCLRKKGSKLYNIYRHVNAPLGSFVYPRHRLRSPPFPETNVRQIAQSNFLDVFESLKKTLRVWSFSGTKRWRLHQLAKYKKKHSARIDLWIDKHIKKERVCYSPISCILLEQRIDRNQNHSRAIVNAPDSSQPGHRLNKFIGG